MEVSQWQEIKSIRSRAEGQMQAEKLPDAHGSCHIEANLSTFIAPSLHSLRYNTYLLPHKYILRIEFNFFKSYI